MASADRVVPPGPPEADPSPRGARPLAAAALAVSLAALGTGESALTLVGRLNAAPRPDGVLVCAYRLRSGHPCLGCGGTRAFASGARGDFAGAAAANPLGAFAGLALWMLTAGSGVSFLTGRPTPLRAALGVVVSLSPAAFLASVVVWWTFLPPGP